LFRKFDNEFFVSAIPVLLIVFSTDGKFTRRQYEYEAI